MTKKERKLLKAAKRLRKASATYIKELTKIDEIIQSLPVGITRRFMLEDRYFNTVPKVASLTVKLELLEAYIANELNINPDDNNNDEDWKCIPF